MENIAQLMQAAAQIDSSFMTVDLAQLESGDWIIMEVGDGQVSGLQEYDPGSFYEQLHQCVACQED